MIDVLDILEVLDILDALDILLFIVFIVEFLLYYYAIEDFFADLHLELGVELGVGSIDESHGYTLVDRDAMIACGDFAYRLASSIENGIAMTRNSLVFELDTYNLLGYTISLLVGKSLFAYELLFVEFAEEAETSHDRRDVGRKFVAIERQTNLEAKSVAAAESARLATA